MIFFLRRIVWGNTKIKNSGINIVDYCSTFSKMLYKIRLIISLFYIELSMTKKQQQQLISDCSSFWICGLVTVTDSLSGQQMAAQPWPLENSLQQRAPLLSNVMPQMASRARNIQTFEWFVNDRFTLRKQFGSFLMCNFQLNRYIFMIPI